MNICRTVEELNSAIESVKLQHKTIGLVPTMGALHDGHKSLFIRARKENDVFVSSVFVNPIQFNNKEDFEKYPRDEQKDLAVLEECGCDIAFVPKAEDVYQQEPKEFHFSGVANIVSRLFLWTKADRAYFGEKDYQQIAIIKDMIRQENINIEIVPCPIYRDEDGLATSSRNQRLSKEARLIAPKIHQILEKSFLQKDSLSFNQITRFVEDEFAKVKEFQLEYFIIVDDTTLQPIHTRENNQGVVGCVAVWLDGVRLIDIQRYY